MSAQFIYCTADYKWKQPSEAAMHSQQQRLVVETFRKAMPEPPNSNAKRVFYY
jgi:hypothetical protein